MSAGRDQPRADSGGRKQASWARTCNATRQAQNSSFSAFAAKAFTTVFAGLAFTSTTLPNISRLPALVAAFLRVLIMHSPGTTNLPLFLVSCAAISQLSAIAVARAPLVITVDFIIGAISTTK